MLGYDHFNILMVQWVLTFFIYYLGLSLEPLDIRLTFSFYVAYIVYTCFYGLVVWTSDTVLLAVSYCTLVTSANI